MTSLADLRQDYASSGLEESELLPSPFDQFGRWFDEARAAGVVEPNAMTLATAGADGVPSARTVLLKGYDERGFVFFTNYESQKAIALAENARATLLFPWIPIGRQVVVDGDVARVSRDETEEYFRTRPRGSQLGAWASKQSAVVASREVLEAALSEVTARYPAGAPVPPPPHWGGYRVAPRTVELWQGRTNRLHDRLRYRRDAAGWTVERLSP